MKKVIAIILAISNALTAVIFNVSAEEISVNEPTLPIDSQTEKFVNVALGASASSVTYNGDIKAGFAVDYLFDGNRDQNRTVLTNSSYFTIDLGNEQEICAIRYYYAGIWDDGTYTVYGSKNNKNFTKLTTFTYERNGAGNTGVIEFTPGNYRYIRLSRPSSGTDSISGYEFEVFAKKDKTLIENVKFDEFKINLNEASFRVKNSSGQSIFAKPVVAYYDNENKLINTQVGVRYEVFDEDIPEILLDIPYGTKKAKLFVWNSTEGIVPIAKGNEAIYIFVSQSSGNDENNGEKGSPVKTVEKARELVREINKQMTGDIYVVLDGSYEITQTFELGQLDSGNNGYDVHYVGINNAQIKMAKTITDFIKEDNYAYAKVNGITDFRQLYVNQNRADRAGSKMLFWSDSIVDYENDSLLNESDSYDAIIMNSNNLSSSIQYEEECELVFYPTWKIIRVPVTSIESTANGLQFNLDEKAFDSAFSQKGISPGTDIPFRIENAKELLDEPGEWYFDKKNSTVYYYPHADEDMQTANIYIPYDGAIVRIAGTADGEKARNIVFENIEFIGGGWHEPNETGYIGNQGDNYTNGALSEDETKYTTFMVPGQFEISHANNIRLYNNKFVHSGMNGVKIYEKTHYCSIEGNLFDDTSASAVSIGTIDADNVLENIKISNNLIRRPSVEYMNAPAIIAYYVAKTQISHNDIKDSPYSAISVGWGWSNSVKTMNDNIISANKINGAMKRLRDGGFIYALSNQDNSHIYGNYLLDSDELKAGIYLDEGSTGFTISGNVLNDRMNEEWLYINNVYGNCSNITAFDNFSNGELGTYAKSFADDALIDSPYEELFIANAGLQNEYKNMLDEYESKTYKNSAMKYPDSIETDGIVISADDYIRGVNGVDFKDDDDIGRPSLERLNDGTGRTRFINTWFKEWTTYNLDVPETGNYKVSITAAINGSGNGRITVGDTSVMGALTDTGGYYNVRSATTEIGTLYLTKGEHIAKVEVGGMFYNAIFEKID